MSEAELEAERRAGHEAGRAGAGFRAGSPPGTPKALALVAWLVVGIPLVWGVLSTLGKAAALFK